MDEVPDKITHEGNSNLNRMYVPSQKISRKSVSKFSLVNHEEFYCNDLEHNTKYLKIGAKKRKYLNFKVFPEEVNDLFNKTMSSFDVYKLCYRVNYIHVHNEFVNLQLKQICKKRSRSFLSVKHDIKGINHINDTKHFPCNSNVLKKKSLFTNSTTIYNAERNIFKIDKKTINKKQVASFFERIDLAEVSDNSLNHNVKFNNIGDYYNFTKNSIPANKLMLRNGIMHLQDKLKCRKTVKNMDLVHSNFCEFIKKIIVRENSAPSVYCKEYTFTSFINKNCKEKKLYHAFYNYCDCSRNLKLSNWYEYELTRSLDHVRKVTSEDFKNNYTGLVDHKTPNHEYTNVTSLLNALESLIFQIFNKMIGFVLNDVIMNFKFCKIVNKNTQTNWNYSCTGYPFMGSYSYYKGNFKGLRFCRKNKVYFVSKYNGVDLLDCKRLDCGDYIKDKIFFSNSVIILPPIITKKLKDQNIEKVKSVPDPSGTQNKKQKNSIKRKKSKNASNNSCKCPENKESKDSIGYYESDESLSKSHKKQDKKSNKKQKGKKIQKKHSKGIGKDKGSSKDSICSDSNESLDSNSSRKGSKKKKAKTKDRGKKKPKQSLKINGKKIKKKHSDSGGKSKSSGVAGKPSDSSIKSSFSQKTSYLDGSPCCCETCLFIKGQKHCSNPPDSPCCCQSCLFAKDKKKIRECKYGPLIDKKDKSKSGIFSLLGKRDKSSKSKKSDGSDDLDKLDKLNKSHLLGEQSDKHGIVSGSSKLFTKLKTTLSSCGIPCNSPCINPQAQNGKNQVTKSSGCFARLTGKFRVTADYCTGKIDIAVDKKSRNRLMEILNKFADEYDKKKYQEKK